MLKCPTATKTARRAAAATGLALSIGVLGAWGPLGHSVIADIAYRELTPEVRARVDQIMAGATIQETASWADGVRGRNDPFPWTAPLHYVNMTPDAPAYDHATFRPEQGNVVDGVVDFSQLLLSTDATDEQRKQALMFVVHFIGDLHQPLHAGNSQDRGGNDIRINWQGRERNLHSIWDSGLYDAVSQSPWPEVSEQLYSQISDEDRAAWLVADPATPKELTEAFYTAAVGRWVLESRLLANRYAYQAPGFNNDQPFISGTQLDKTYAEKCRPVIELRFKQAGVRLGHALNMLLDPTTAPTIAREPDTLVTDPAMKASREAAAEPAAGEPDSRAPDAAAPAGR